MATKSGKKITKSKTKAIEEERRKLLTERRNLKMARSAHAYVRGSTEKFYEWLESGEGKSLPEGPAVWICGDCHHGNLGPIANKAGKIDVQIRDLDQTVIGNPAHDLIRLSLSLASAARSSDLPGVMTARMIEEIMLGYEAAFLASNEGEEIEIPNPASVQAALDEATKRSWRHLAKERIEDASPEIPLGKKYWKITKDERKGIDALFAQEDVRKLVTSLKSRDDDAKIEVLDAAYWRKGCSSLGLLRYAVVVGIRSKGKKSKTEYCLVDIKEAAKAVAPRDPKADMPRDNAERVATGARNLAPALGRRMVAARLFDKPVFIRELMPQDLKIDIEHLTAEEAIKAARYYAAVIGEAHARQMTLEQRTGWNTELQKHRSKSLDAPSWLWSSVVSLLVMHEPAYLEHCRKYAMNLPLAKAVEEDLD